MIKTYKDIQDQIDIDFDNYLSVLLSVDNEPRKYFYWSLDYFRIIGGLSFQYFILSDNKKDEINILGNSHFESTDIYFQINKNSHRHDLLIKNFYKLFDSKVSDQTKRYEYIKEFIFWEILKALESKKIVGSDIVKLQKNNYLITYITYLINNTSNPTFNPFKNYIKYNLTNKGEDLLKRLNELDDKGVGNEKLRKKIGNLYVLNSDESKIHFVFSRNGGGEKEELRELLEIMGKEDTGKLYRGQANSFWNLDASITREPKYLENEGNMYYDILSLKPDAFKNDTTVYEKLITMQHFGMPTRLLDVTRNPLVAIFFACNNMERKDNDGVIFTFKPEKSKFLNFEDERLKYLKILYGINDLKKNKESDEFLSDIWFLKGVAKNQRINNQSGDFIFAGNGDEAKQKLHQLVRMSIIIDSKTKEVLIEQLASLNIHGGAVYPDLTHMSNYISEKYKKETSSIKQLESITPKMKRTKFPKKTDKTKSDKELIPSFDFKKIKDKDRASKLTTFAKHYDLNKVSLSNLIDNFLTIKKKPYGFEITEIANQKMSLLKEKEKINMILKDIIILAKLVEEKKEE